MKKSKIVKNVVGLLLLLVSFTVSAQYDPLINRLKLGGLNIFIRHAITPGTDPNKFNPPTERTNDCSAGSRQLNDIGREQSRTIGFKIEQLEIPIGEVYSSKFCRCEETARLAFNKVIPVDWLVVRHGVFQSQLDKELRSVPSSGFFNKVPTGKNNVFVGHHITFSSGVLSKDFPKINLEEGEAVIIEPGDTPRILGKIKFY